MTVEVQDNPFMVSYDTKKARDIATKEVSALMSFAKELAVVSEESYKKMTSFYAKAREWKKALEAKRKELVEPLRKRTSAINDKAKELSDPLDAIIEIANDKTAKYLHALEQAKRIEDEKLRAAAACFQAEEELYIPPTEKIRGDGATAVTKIEKDFRVIDKNIVPYRYLMVNESSIKQDIKLGVHEIPGIEIFEVKTTRLATR